MADYAQVRGNGARNKIAENFAFMALMRLANMIF
jgi:hypothetical protein